MQVPEHPQCDPQKIRIIHVGMGASGMLCAVKARRMLSNFELVCYEKNSEVGGTWWENRYPGEMKCCTAQINIIDSQSRMCL